MNEVSLASKEIDQSEIDQFRVNFNVLMAPGAQGGHEENTGLLPTGEVIKAPLHRHQVGMSTYRFDVGLQYSMSEHWMLEANLPYSVRLQEASVQWIDPVTPEERKSILDSSQIHHRSGTYTGPSDWDVFLGYTDRGFFKSNDLLFVRLGTTVPIGKTEHNPWHLGSIGREHLHIQFGTGTFNPSVSLQYSLPLYRGIGLTASTRGTFPFYENSKSYQGSVEVSYTAGFTYGLFDWLLFTGNYLGFYQGSAYWDGDQDVNTGLRYTMASFGLSLVMLDGVAVSANVMLPLTQATLYDGSDAIEFGNLTSVTTTYSF